MSPLHLALLQMTGARLIGLVATVIGFAVLARLLEPAVFGHFAVAFSIYNLVKILSNFGLRQYIIRAEGEIDGETLSAAAGLSLVIAAMGCLAFVAAGVALGGGLLPEPLAAALVPLGLALLAGPLSLSVEAQLHRGMVFGLPARAAVASAAAEVAVAIALAWAGFGVVALAVGTLAAQVVLAATLLLGGAVAHRVRPRLRLGGFSGLGGFGGRLTVINLLPSAADIVLISTLSGLSGPAATGLYNRALVIRDLLDRTLLEGIAPVVLPALSDALRGGMRPGAVLATKLDYLAAICWPAFALIALMAGPLVDLLLGAQWREAVPAVRILAVGGLALPITKMSVKFFTAIGALDAYLRIQAADQVVRLTLGAAGAAISLEAFCAAVSAAMIVKAGWILAWLHGRYGGLDGGHGRAMLRGAAVTAITVAAPAAIMRFAEPGLPSVLAAAVAAVAGWLAALWLCRHPLLQDARAMSKGLRAPGLPVR